MEGLIATLHDSQFGGLYKNTEKTKESAQQKRRQEALDRLKNKRQDEFDRNRKIYEINVENVLDEFDDTNSNFSETTSTMTDFSETGNNKFKVPSYKKTPAYKRQQKRKKFHPRMVGQLMKNDWLLEKPEDIEDWVFQPCPKGNQCLLISVNGHTRLFSNKGYCRLQCGTALPSGNRSNTSCHPTILDVIVCWETNTIYVLDLLKWKGYEYYDSSAEFRQEWKNVKISELGNQGKYKFKIKSLPAFSTDDVSSAKQFYDKCDFDVDGILCYHKNGVYYPSGQEEDTYALYGWTTKDKMKDVLGVECNFLNTKKNEMNEEKENNAHVVAEIRSSSPRLTRDITIDPEKPPATPPDTSSSKSSSSSTMD